MFVLQVAATSIPDESADADDTSNRTSFPDCSVSLSASVAASLASRRFDMFTATDAASATMDFTKDSVDDNVVDSPPSRGPVRTPVCSPSPLKRLCTSPSRRRSMSPNSPTSKTPQRQLYPAVDTLHLPIRDSSTSPSLVNVGGLSRRANPPCHVNNVGTTRTTRSLGGVPLQLISRGNPLPHAKPLGSRPPPSRRASCTLRPYPPHVALASPSSSRPSRSLDSLRRRDGESFDTWFSRRSEILGTSCMPNSRRNDLLRALVKQGEGDAKSLDHSTKLNRSKSNGIGP